MNLHLGQEDQVAQEVLGVPEFVWIHLEKLLECQVHLGHLHHLLVQVGQVGLGVPVW